LDGDDEFCRSNHVAKEVRCCSAISSSLEKKLNERGGGGDETRLPDLLLLLLLVLTDGRGENDHAVGISVAVDHKKRTVAAAENFPMINYINRDVA
jgi:hypothetical protein